MCGGRTEGGGGERVDWLRLATRHCSAASHLISSSSDGAQQRKVRLGVIILKQCS